MPDPYLLPLNQAVRISSEGHNPISQGWQGYFFNSGMEINSRVHLHKRLLRPILSCQGPTRFARS